MSHGFHLQFAHGPCMKILNFMVKDVLHSPGAPLYAHPLRNKHQLQKQTSWKGELLKTHVPTNPLSIRFHEDFGGKCFVNSPCSTNPTMAWCPEFPREMHFRRLEGVGKDGSTSSCDIQRCMWQLLKGIGQKGANKNGNKDAVTMWQSWSESLLLVKCLQSGDHITIRITVL